MCSYISRDLPLLGAGGETPEDWIFWNFTQLNLDQRDLTMRNLEFGILNFA